MNLSYPLIRQSFEALPNNKKEARAHMNAHIAAQNTSVEFCKHAGVLAIQHFAQSVFFKNAAVIFVFYALKTEIPTLPLIHRALENGKKIAIPRMRKTENEIDFYYLNTAVPLKNQLEAHPFGIQEPLENLQKAEFTDLAQSGVLLVPALAFTKDGNRLGHGKGYYDRFISGLEAKTTLSEIPRIGMCFSYQLVETLPHESHDQRVTHLLTENGLFSCSSI